MPELLRWPGLPREARPMLTGLSLLALSLVVLAAPEMLGGVYAWGMLWTAALALAALGLTLASNSERGPELSAPLLAMFVALGWTALQALPWPCALAEGIAQPAAAHLQQSHRLLGMPEPRWCPVSRDPGATREEIVKGIAIVAAFLSASGLCVRGHRGWVLGAVTLSAVVLALVGIAHEAVDAERVFGWYKPVEVRSAPLLAPVLNPNTLGGVFAMCVPVLIGLVLATPAARARAPLLLAMALLASCVFMTRSRGAIGALVAGCALFVLLAWRRRAARRGRREGRARTRLEQLGVPLGVACALAVSAVGWHQEITAEFEQGSWNKLRLIAAGANLTLEQPWTGVGRGAFAAAFATALGTRTRFRHAENLVVQWASEWGLLIALVLIGALAYGLFRAARKARSLERIGAIAGVAAISLQNLVDLGLELVGVAVPAAALLAVALTEQSGTGAARQATRLRGTALCAAFAVLGVALVAALWSRVEREHAFAVENHLKAQLEHGNRAEFRAVLARAVLAHPSEPVFAVFAASEALRHRDPAAGRWINRGMQLAPGWAEPHLQAAEWLLRAGRFHQGLLELKLAARIDLVSSRRLLCPVAERHLPAVTEIAPTGKDRARFYKVLGGCFRADSASSTRIDALILRESPEDPLANLREGRRRLKAGDAAGALVRSQHALRQSEQREHALLLQARALAALGRKPEAIRALREGQRWAERPSLLLALEADLHSQLGDRAATEAALGRLKGLASASSEQLAQAFALEAQLEHQLGSPVGALRAFEESYRVTGDTGALRGIARTAEKLGNRGRAAWAYGQICDTVRETTACQRRRELLATSR